MASQTYNFTMSNNFVTRVVLSDQSVGTLNYTVTYIRPNTGWTSYNLNTGTSGPEWSFNMSGTNSPSLGSGISGFWNYDFRNLPEKEVTRCVVNSGNTLVRVNGLTNGAAVGDIIRTGTTGIPSGTRITGFEGVSSINIRLSAAPTTSSSSRTLVFGTPNTNMTAPVFSGSVSVPPGGTVTFGGLVESKTGGGQVAISGSFVTLADPEDPDPPIDPTPAPSFSDQSITTTWIKTLNFSGAPDRRVSASNTSSYSIVASGTGLSPTAWLTINSSGQLSGVPAAVGVYTFRVRATGEGGSTNSSIITLTINPPGNRSAGTGVPIDLTNAKRFDGTNWNTNISIFKRFDGNNWVDITN
jgi:hypothetical protein